MNKFNFRKFSLLFCVLACVFSLTACSDPISSAAVKESAKEKQLEEYSEELQLWATHMVAFLDMVSDEDLKKYAENSDTLDELIGYDYVVNPDGVNVATVGFYNGWVKTREDLGAIKTIDSVDIAINEDTGVLCTISVSATYAERVCKFEFIINEDLNMNSAAINPEYTTMEKMQKAAMNTIIGMGTVFVVLIFISFIISLFKYINLIGAKKSPEKKEESAGIDSAIAQIVTSEEESETDDLELVAVITAAIAAMEGTSPDGLVVRSIRKVKRNGWK